MVQTSILQKPFVAVIGYPNWGKSTIIQSLTGCPNRSFKGEIFDASVGRSIYVHSPSPQENPLSEKKFISILKRVRGNRVCQGVLIAIQPGRRWKRLEAGRMFGLARKSRFDTYAFIIECPFNADRRSGKRIDKFAAIKKNVLENDPNAKIFSIDARRFAVLNAELIRSIVRIPY